MKKRKSSSMATTTEELVAPIEASELSEVTKRVYRDRIRVWENDTQKTMWYIMMRPEVYIPFLKENRGSSMQTLKSYISVILTLFRYTPALREKHKQTVHKWYVEFKATHKQIEEKYTNNTASEKQKEAYLPFSEIIAKRDLLDKGSTDRLLLSMYTYIPPLRADFNHIPVYINRPVSAESEADNYILLKTSGAGSPEGTLVLREFKTKKKLAQIESKLPEQLAREILSSLEERPRLFLFHDRSGAPYTPHGYTQFVNRTLKRLFQKPITISMLRHSFINSLDFNKVTVKEREQIARMMAHSVGMQDRYRLLFRDEEGGLLGTGQECTLQCGPLRTSEP